MKNNKRVRLGFAAILLAIAVNAQTFDNQVLLPDLGLNGLRPMGESLLVDPQSADPAQPRLFLGLISAPTSIWRISPYPTYPEYTAEPLDGGLRRVKKLAYHTNEQRLYALGDAIQDPTRKNSPSVWRVRSSDYTDNGIINWEDVDTVSLARGAWSLATGIAFDANGAVFVSGRALNSKGYIHWMVRRKLQGQTTWETVYNHKLIDQFLDTKLCFFPGGNNKPAAMFAVGNQNYKWTILRSIANATTGTFGDLWETVDTWPDGNAEAAATDIAYDSMSGRLYVIGCRGRLYSSATGWIVRASADGGDSWSPLLDKGFPSYSYPDSLTWSTTIVSFH